eukprot:m.214037 g.214037  ORF g.214037 m.214037 type:complete len:180 (-) comp10143_c3_seq2:1408-1947(-)
MAVSQVLAIVMALACVSEAIVSIPVHRHRVSRRIARDEVTMLSGSSYTAPIPPDSYMIYVSIGTPPQQLKLLVDTGSSNLAVSISAQAGGPPPYFQAASSSTYQLVAANALDMEYVVGDWRGDIVQDIVTVENAPNISVASIISPLLFPLSSDSLCSQCLTIFPVTLESLFHRAPLRGA